MNIEKRLELILDAANYCRAVKAKGMPPSSYSKALREPIHFLWEKRNGSSKKKAAQYISEKAKNLDFGGNELRYDHAVPFKFTMKEIMEVEVLGINTLKRILETKIVVCLITKSEDDHLRSLGLNSRMPSDWDGFDMLARYKAAEIKVQKKS